jgi:hypothetical protein
MTLVLRKIQTISVEKSTAEDVMRSIIDELKTLNPKVKSYLKNKKRLVEIQTKNVKNNYVLFSQKLSKSLTKFINEIRTKTNDQNKDIIEMHLKVLKKENNYLLNFNDISFNNSSEVKARFLSILNKIKDEFFEIKTILKK